MTTTTRRAVLVTAMLAPAVARAQGVGDYPTRPITLIAAGAAGGPTDTITRIIADAMGKILPVPVVVESIGGSLVAGLALVEKAFDAETLWRAVSLDDLYQERRWGPDAEAQATRAAHKRDWDNAVRFLELL